MSRTFCAGASTSQARYRPVDDLDIVGGGSPGRRTLLARTAIWTSLTQEMDLQRRLALTAVIVVAMTAAWFVSSSPVTAGANTPHAVASTQ